MKKFVLNRCFIQECLSILKWSPLQSAYPSYGTYRSGLRPLWLLKDGLELVATLITLRSNQCCYWQQSLWYRSYICWRTTTYNRHCKYKQSNSTRHSAGIMLNIACFVHSASLPWKA